ncbi:MAG: 4-hydroxy-3-methylbut-2-en-1-yl diphosphate synthase [Omnitrophica WOR_2 bacterium RIFCSPHIGHO2_01_FULL_48_9]|nr:MAG: 4-hydroxy-3-methylbut-2-en-1-yl diphosphate synthase [Omnitrophica WOR_2 bacterium RIFCSPHIGHO2_02_FULL_48_11]OGX33713.1 MAG: 4-hydroxy-3-methylbut-2-en-1-yl diphosphate synthase [Omnitrophica WOR_2 bacterium RIFCSPHIGHO2_01_FULL_48_9]
MELIKRRKTPTVKIGSVSLGSGYPVVVQSMTDTPTADVEKTFAQTVELIEAGSELVRWTINDDAAALAVPETIQRLRDKGYMTPIIGDFHFNGHTLLNKHKDCAKVIDKYRINPGNVGKGDRHDENFSAIVKIAIENNKAVRIGVNWGSLDQEMLTDLMDKNAKLKSPKDFKEVTYAAMLQSTLTSAELAEKLGLPKNKIILSVKMSILQDMVAVYSRLAKKCDYALHLGLTEAGGDVQGIASSAAALSILLQQGIGDTIRVSLTPQPGVPRKREVEVCKNILQSLGLRYFKPSVTSCPGCGRTSSNYFQILAQDINQHIERKMPLWKKEFPGIEKLKIAVMGCVVNGPGESRHADIGISLPGASEKPIAPVYVDGKEYKILKGEQIKEEFMEILEKYIRTKFN